MSTIMVKEVHKSPKKAEFGFVPTKYVAILFNGDEEVYRTHNYNSAEVALKKAKAYCTQRGIEVES